ncbi:hypothetical protein ACQJBY_020350 [Aegilops geniculata]
MHKKRRIMARSTPPSLVQRAPILALVCCSLSCLAAARVALDGGRELGTSPSPVPGPTVNAPGPGFPDPRIPRPCPSTPIHAPPTPPPVYGNPVTPTPSVPIPPPPILVPGNPLVTPIPSVSTPYCPPCGCQ